MYSPGSETNEIRRPEPGPETRSQRMRPFWQPVALLAGAADFFEAEAPLQKALCINNTVAQARYRGCPPPGLFSLVNILP